MEEIEFEEIGDILVVKARGELAVRDASSFRSKLQERLKGAHLRVVLDCTGLTFIDSAGFGELLVCRQRLKKNGGQFHLACLGASVKSVMKTYNAGNLLTAHDSVAEAMAAAKKS